MEEVKKSALLMAMGCTDEEVAAAARALEENGGNKEGKEVSTH